MNMDLDFASDPSQPTWEPPRILSSLKVHGNADEAAQNPLDTSPRADALARAQQQLLELCSSTGTHSAPQQFLTTWCNSKQPPVFQANVLAWLQAMEPLATAIRNGQEAIVPTLLAYGLKPEKADLWAALSSFEDSGSRKALEMLLGGGWDIDEPLNENATSLLGYFVVKDEDVVDWCLSLGASPNATSPMGESAMHRAAAFGSLETLKTLKEHGGIIESTDLVAHAALAYCNGDDGRLDIIRYLLDHGAPIDAYYMDHSKRWNSPDNSLFLTYGRQNALHFAITYDKKELLEFLLARGADRTSKMLSLRTELKEIEPLELVALLGHSGLRFPLQQNLERAQLVPSCSLSRQNW